MFNGILMILVWGFYEAKWSYKFICCSSCTVYIITWADSSFQLLLQKAPCPSLMLFVGFVHVTFSMVWLGTSRYRKAFIRLATDAYLKLKILITLIGLTACHVTTNNRPMKMLKFESCCCTTLSGLSFDFFPFRNSFRNSASIFYFSAAANFLD